MGVNVCVQGGGGDFVGEGGCECRYGCVGECVGEVWVGGIRVCA